METCFTCETRRRKEGILNKKRSSKFLCKERKEKISSTTDLVKTPGSVP
jgi:hypothetical protein